MGNALTSRRVFIGGAASFGTFAACRLFAGHDFRAGGTPNLKFGVVSDVHIREFASGKNCAANCSVMKHTFEWFRDQGAVAVMIVGDMADHGLTDELQVIADTWNDVFPNGRAPDGHPVEKLFVYGNHDWEGFAYGDFAKKSFLDETERNRHILRKDYAKNWERIFGEAYAPIYKKVINGYTFIGQHWDQQGWGDNCRFERVVPFLSEHGSSLDPNRPFFYFQHPHPKDTCYGSWAWGHDIGVVTKALSAFPNAIAFSGHSHYSLTDERSIWQGSFTSIGTSSLRYTCMPYSSRMPLGYENSTVDGEKADALNATKVMTHISSNSQQGMLVSVYDDCVAIRRREFGCDIDLGDDWVMPLPAAESKPFAFAKRARKSTAPQFPAGAKITISRKKAKTRKGRGHEPVEKDALLLTFPAALANRIARPFEYEVAAISEAGAKTVFRVLAAGFNHGRTHKDAQGDSTCLIPIDRLPADTVRFEVMPLDSWWNSGEPLTCIYDARGTIKSSRNQMYFNADGSIKPVVVEK